MMGGITFQHRGTIILCKNNYVYACDSEVNNLRKLKSIFCTPNERIIHS